MPQITAIIDNVFMMVFLRISDVLVQSATRFHNCMSPCRTEGRLERSIRPEVDCCEGLQGAIYDSQYVEKDGPADKKCHDDHAEHCQNEPGSTPTGVLGGLGDPKRSEK